MTDVWSADEPVIRPEGEDIIGASALINGSYIELESGSNFAETIQQLARDAGFGKFRVFLNSEEVKPNESPTVIGESDKVEIRQYDVAG